MHAGLPLPSTGREALSDSIAILGGQTFDIHLCECGYWRCVPGRVWRYTLGGYQVVKKWLSYREQSLLGRPLHEEKAREVTVVVRRNAALLLLQPRLDANYAAVKADTGPPLSVLEPVDPKAAV